MRTQTLHTLTRHKSYSKRFNIKSKYHYKGSLPRFKISKYIIISETVSCNNMHSTNPNLRQSFKPNVNKLDQIHENII